MIAPSNIYGANGRLLEVKKPGRVNFGYKAIETNGKRANAPKQTRSEDCELGSRKRRKLNASAEDQARNFALVGWMIRQQVSFVSQFNFKIRTTSDELTDALSRKFSRAIKRRSFDVAGRHGMNRAMGLFEQSKIIKGDALLVKTKGGKVQMFESDLIAKPDAFDKNNKLTKAQLESISDLGLVLSREGAVLKFCLNRWSNDGNALVFDRFVDAENAIYDGYFSRYSQTRGISPLTAALNTCADLYDSFEVTLMKQRAQSLLAFAFFRDAIEDNGFATTGEAGFDLDSEGAEFPANGYKLDLSSNILNIDLEPGDDVKMLETTTPTAGTSDFWNAIIRIALLAMDIPYTFFDGKGASYSHVKRDQAMYLRQAIEKQRGNAECLEDWRDWILDYFLATDPQLAGLVRSAYGDDLESLQDAIAIVPVGAGLLNEKDEAETAALLISQGLLSRQQWMRARNLDFFQTAEELGEEEAWFKTQGATVTVGQPGATGPSSNNTNEATADE